MNMNEMYGIKSKWLLALVFISGICSPILMIGLIIVILLKYSNEFVVKNQCMKAIKLFVLFQIIFAVQNILDYFVGFIGVDRSGFNQVNNKISYILLIVQIGCYLWMAYNVYYNEQIVLSADDTEITTTISYDKGTENNEPVICPNCGKKVSSDSKFCIICGCNVRE